MVIENDLDAYLGGFHLDALFSAVPLNVDLDTTLTGKTPRHWLARHRGPGQRVRREDQLDGK